MSTPLINLLVVQATPFCNIDCKYCYLPNRNSKAKLSLDTCINIFRRVFDSDWYKDQITVVWHAGEPMAVSPRVYDEYFDAIEQLRPQGLSVHHSFQTNGTLINDEWCDLIARRNVRIGVSIDGPEDIHDKNRVSRTGRGTFCSVMKGIDKLKAHSIGFSAICVLTRAALRDTDRMFQFFLDLNPTALCFNIEEIEGINKTSSLTIDSAYSECNAFFRHFWSLMSERKTGFAVREFEEAVSTIVRPINASVYNTQTEPFSIVSVDCDGNFSTFSPEFLGLHHKDYGDYCFGNLNSVNLESAIQNYKFLKLNEDIQSGVNSCKRECAYFTVCGGGAPINKLAENGSFRSTETMFCRITKMLLTDIAMDFIDATSLS